MTHTGTFLFVFLHSFLSVSEIEKDRSQLKTKETVTFLQTFIYFPFFLFFFCFCCPDRCVSTSLTSAVLQNLCGTSMRGRSDIFQFWNYYVRFFFFFFFFFFFKSVQKKPKWLEAAAGSKLVNQKIWETCVCLFHKALISCFISSSTCGWLPAGLVVFGPQCRYNATGVTHTHIYIYTHTHTHIHTHRMDNTWPNKPFTLESNLISQGSWYLFEKSPFLAFLQYDIQCM